MLSPCVVVPPDACLSRQGYLYVEAEKEAHVKDAIKGLRTMFSSKGVKLVPLMEMVEAITVNKKAKMNIGEREVWGTPPGRESLESRERDIAGACLSSVVHILLLTLPLCSLPLTPCLISPRQLGARAPWAVQGRPGQGGRRRPRLDARHHPPAAEARLQRNGQQGACGGGDEAERMERRWALGERSHFESQGCSLTLLTPLPPSAGQDEAERRKFPFGKQPAVRPPSKPFNAEEARQLALAVTRLPGPDGQTYLQIGSHK